MRDKFISKLDVRHFCSTAAGERASKGQQPKSSLKWSDTGAPHWMAAMPHWWRVCVCVFWEIFCVKWKRQRGERKERPYVTWIATANWSQQLYYSLSSTAEYLGCFSTFLPLLQQHISRLPQSRDQHKSLLCSLQLRPLTEIANFFHSKLTNNVELKVNPWKKQNKTSYKALLFFRKPGVGAELKSSSSI